jgi:DNA transposition AAA+ family ATPase
MSNQEAPLAGTFIETKEYRRFAEFCDACCRYHYIGLCYGHPGVGKTLGARHYAEWDLLEPLWLHYITDRSRPKEIVDCRTVLYTPPVINTPRAIDKELERLQHMLCTLVEEAILVHQAEPSQMRTADPLPNLVIVDEADRLKMTSLEHVRDRYDQGKFGLILIGMPGIEKRLTRYPQLYSRVGFVHQFRPLSTEEVQFILEHKWDQLGIKLQPDDFTDAEAIATVIRITGGNFRLIHRLCLQVERILQLNDLHLVTKEVVETAREQLVIGQA